MVFAWAVLFVAIGVVTLVLVARNFQDTIFGSRGYLTNALPARIVDHVTDKTINGVVWAVLTTLMSIIAIALFIVVNPAARESFFEHLWSISFAQSDVPEMAKAVGVAVISFLVLSALVVSWLFAGISLGSMAKRRPGLAKALAFVVLALVWLLVTNTLSATYAHFLLVQAVFAVVFSAMSTYVLNCHLNLE